MSTVRTSSTLSSALTIALLGSAAAPAAAGRLVAVDGNRTLYELDPATGAATAIGTVSANAETTAGLARDPATGTIYLTSTGADALFTLDLSTGAATLVGTYSPTSVVMHGLEWDPVAGTLWGGTSGQLHAIDPATGANTLVGSTGTTSFLNLVHDPVTDTLFGTSSSTDSLYVIDRATGGATIVGVLGAGVTNPNGLAFDVDTARIYLVDNNSDRLYTVNPATGAATEVGPHGLGTNLLGLVAIPTGSAFTPFCFGDGSGTACPCGNVGLAGNGCASSVNPNGANLAAVGNASISGDTLLLAGTGMPNSSALYFQGTLPLAGGGGSGVVFGDGLRCAGGTVLRLGTRANAGGASQYPGPGDASVSVRGACAPGDARTYQVWYRNAASFCTPGTFNLTNGVALTWST